jgi:hypothetical protein
MPTINEVWEQAQQINANLATLHNDLTALQNCCATSNQRINDVIARTDETNDWLEELRQIVDDGLAAISAGIAGIHARQDRTNYILSFQAAQQKTIICILENISHNTCTLVDHAAQQTDLQASLVASIGAMQHMYATVNPDAALAYQRYSEERRQLEACCPPKLREPGCTYEQCFCQSKSRPFDGRKMGHTVLNRKMVMVEK